MDRGRGAAGSDAPEVLDALRRQCVVTWPPGCLEVVAVLAAGHTERQAGRALALSERAVRRRLEQARDTLSDGLGVPANTAMLIAWFSLHAGCCSAGTLKKFAGSAR